MPKKYFFWQISLQTLPAGCRLEVITVQEEVEETKVDYDVHDDLFVHADSKGNWVNDYDDYFNDFFWLRLKRSSARLSSDQRALSSWRRTAKMSPGSRITVLITPFFISLCTYVDSVVQAGLWSWGKDGVRGEHSEPVLLRDQGRIHRGGGTGWGGFE